VSPTSKMTSLITGILGTGMTDKDLGPGEVVAPKLAFTSSGASVATTYSTTSSHNTSTAATASTLCTSIATDTLSAPNAPTKVVDGLLAP
jgi:hypothetical protein